MTDVNDTPKVTLSEFRERLDQLKSQRKLVNDRWEIMHTEESNRHEASYHRIL